MVMPVLRPATLATTTVLVPMAPPEAKVSGNTAPPALYAWVVAAALVVAERVKVVALVTAVIVAPDGIP
jgi:hypothetical protein